MNCKRILLNSCITNSMTMGFADNRIKADNSYSIKYKVIMGSILLVSTGNFIKSISREQSARWLTKHFSFACTYETFTTNILVCLLIAIIFGLVQHLEWVISELHFFLANGFCVGFKPLLSITLENINSLQYSSQLTLSISTISSFTDGLLVTFGGITLTKIRYDKF